jgi:hypothetical protein
MSLRERLSRVSIPALIGGVVIGAAIAGAYRQFVLLPALALNQKRYEASLDISTLFGLQLAYQKSKGVFASDINALLSVAPDPDALRKSLAANVDMNTLTVVGNRDKFKIEMNVLDPDRTLYKISGPILDAKPVRARDLPAPPPPMNADGAPVGR